ncbi:MAG TPA: hypothetical protein V6C57_28000, partial [Coleofasciculaceae cyanobacterium]
MTVTEIRDAFEQKGFKFSEQEVEEKLAAAKMNADEVDAEMMAVWLEAMEQQQNQPVKSGKGGGLAKSKTAPPAKTSAPTQTQEIPVDFPGPNQAASIVQNTVVKLVQANHLDEQQAINALAGYYAESPTRVMNGINQQLSAMGVSNPLESVLQQQRESWASAHSAIQEAIANVNDFAG